MGMEKETEEEVRSEKKGKVLNYNWNLVMASWHCFHEGELFWHIRVTD